MVSIPKLVSTVKVKVISLLEETKVGEMELTLEVKFSVVTLTNEEFCLISSM